jgi:ribosomal protein L18E
MPRKPSDIVQPNLRIREDLRRRLERAATKAGRSLNQEMTQRLRASFDQGDRIELSRITADLDDVYKRLVRDLAEQSRTQELISAAEHFIEKVRKGEAVDGAIEWVETAIKAITRIHGRTYIHERE